MPQWLARFPITLTALLVPPAMADTPKAVTAMAGLELSRPATPDSRRDRGADLWMPTPPDHVRPAARPSWELQLAPQVTDRLRDKMMPWPEHPTAVDANRNYCRKPPIPAWKRFMLDQQAWADGKTAQGFARPSRS